MKFFHQTSPAARVSLVYITIGSLLVVWTGVWFAYLYQHPPQSDHTYYWVTGSLITGVTLLIIGLSLGRIGEVSRPAEAPGTQTIPPVQFLPKETAPVAPSVPMAPVVAPAALPAPPPVYQGPGNGTPAGR